MPASLSLLRPDRRIGGLVFTIALHLLLLWSWHATVKAPPRPEADAPRMAITWIDTKRPRAQPDPAPARPAARNPLPRPQTERPPAMHLVPPPDRPEATSAPATTTPAMPDALADAPPAAHQSAADMLDQARRDIGKFDKELRKEFAQRGISKPPDSPQIRLARGMEGAADAVPPKWYEAAKIKEIIDPGQYGRKRYRVTTAFGTYCVTYESPNSPTAQLDVGKRVEPKMTNCPPHEQAPTKQAW